MKHLYAAPQMEPVCVDADIIRTSGKMISIYDLGEADGVGAAYDKYNFSEYFNFN